MMFSNIKQSHKEIVLILLSFFLLILFSFGSRYYTLYHIQEIKYLGIKITKHPLQVSNAALTAQLNIFRLRQQMLEVVYFPDKEKLAERIYKIHAYEKEAQKNLDIVNKLILGEKGQLMARETNEIFHERTAFRERIIAYAIQDNKKEMLNNYISNEDSYAQLESMTLQLAKYARGRASMYNQQADELYAEFEKNNNYITLVLIFLFSFIIYYTVRRIWTFINSNEKLAMDLNVQSKHLQQVLEEELNKEETLIEQAHIFDAIQDSIFLHDLEGNFIYLNENAWKTRGYTYEEMMGMNVREIDSPEFVENHPELFKSAIEEMRKFEHIKIRVEHVCKNGDRLPVEIYAKMIKHHGMPCILSSVRDISQQLRREEEIQKLSTVVEQIDDSVIMTDINGVIQYVNNAFCSHLGYRKEEIIGNNPRMFKSNHHNNDFYDDLWKTIVEGKTYRNTLINKKKNGDIFYENKTITPLRDHNEKIIGFVSTGKDVTKEVLLHQEMQRIATIDKLTGIYNRHKFEELLIFEMERSRRSGEPLSLILIDIDNFKNVNDTYGHDTGDEVLKYLVKIVQDHIRQMDIFSRWGGEEFLLLSPSTDLDKAQLLAEKLREAVEKADFPKVLRITISEGVSSFGEQESFDEVFKRVDRGLYWAKEHGRNQVGVTPR